MGRITSGILATIGGSLAILVSIILFGMMGYSNGMFFLLLGLAELTGGVLLLCDIMAGGIVALVGGSVAVFFSIVFSYGLPEMLTLFMGIVHTMALSSGITGITSSSEL